MRKYASLSRLLACLLFISCCSESAPGDSSTFETGVETSETILDIGFGDGEAGLDVSNDVDVPTGADIPLDADVDSKASDVETEVGEEVEECPPGLPDEDNCPLNSNPEQSDVDGDGDVCDPSADYYYPPVDPLDNSWYSITPTSLGWDETQLAEMLQYAEHHDTTGFIVLHKGRIVVEQYWQSWDQHTADCMYSASKSVMAALTSIVIQDGLLASSDVVSEWIGPEWSFAQVDKEQLITIRHLLTMTSGLSVLLTYQGDAGTIWNYNTHVYKKLRNILESVTGQDLNTFAQSRLFEPIGMRESNWRNTTVMDASVRDMARFGLLVLSDGTWDGTPILTDPAFFQAMLDSSQALNPAYGYLWWLNGKDGYLIPSGEDTPGTGWIIPDGPPDLVAALGLGDKKIYVVPSLDLVVVRHGNDAGTPQLAISSFDNELWRLLMMAIPENS
jgi:CubicO group peptidase (beta-lactamase class C family)